jgi:MYXO-CTERM domain-containing protein
MLLPYHGAAAARRATYKPEVEEPSSIAWGYPITMLALVALGAAAVARRRRG